MHSQVPRSLWWYHDPVNGVIAVPVARPTMSKASTNVEGFDGSELERREWLDGRHRLSAGIHR
jgi:hypothetical protein